MTNNIDPVRAREILARVIAAEEAKGYAGRFGEDQKHVPECLALEAISEALASAPASAPVGVEGFPPDVQEIIRKDEAGWALAKLAELRGAERDESDNGTWWTLRIEHFNALAQQPAAPALAKHQPCGCVICTCEDERQCQGCGAKHCGNRADHPPYVGQRPAAENVPQDAGRVAVHFLARIFAAQEARHDGEDHGWKINGKGGLNEVVAEARAWLAGEQPASPSGEAVAPKRGEPMTGAQAIALLDQIGAAVDSTSRRFTQEPTAPQQPAGVDEAMVERAVRAAERFSDEGQITFEGMRAALTAALAAQQQGDKA